MSDPKSWASDSIALKTYTKVVWPLVQKIKKQQQASTPTLIGALAKPFGYASHTYARTQNGPDTEPNCDPKLLEVRELGRRFS